MKTTLELQPDLLSAAKRKALEEGKTLKAVVEEALSSHLGRPTAGAFRLRQVVFSKPRLQTQPDWKDLARHLYPNETAGGYES